MDTVKRSRRVLAGLAGLAVAVVTALAAASPAQAQGVEPPPRFDTCAGTHLLLPGIQGGSWTVTVGGDAFFPAEGDEQPGPGEVVNLFVPAGSGEIAWTLFVGEQAVDSGTHTWTDPGTCDELPDPTHTQPTCDAPGTITIPELPGEETGGAIEREGAGVQAEGPTSVPGVSFRLDGNEVEAGSTHEVEPGTHEVTLQQVFTFGAIQVELIVQRWVIDIEEPDCPDEPGQPSEPAEPSEPAQPGEGGELPKTGNQAVLFGVGALVMLAVGGAMYLVARRRRITFTA
ncbi:MAG: LPXTG cell wall anchor domain-containing protein [Micromonosporaceae bacterium]